MSAGERMFPVHSYQRHPSAPAAVPWAFLAPHEAQARRNHDQSLERLAERGGLSEAEMVAVVTGQGYFFIVDLSKRPAEAAERLNALLAEWSATSGEKGGR